MIDFFDVKDYSEQLTPLTELCILTELGLTPIELQNSGMSFLPIHKTPEQPMQVDAGSFLIEEKNIRGLITVDDNLRVNLSDNVAGKSVSICMQKDQPATITLGSLVGNHYAITAFQENGRNGVDLVSYSYIKAHGPDETGVSTVVANRLNADWGLESYPVNMAPVNEIALGMYEFLTTKIESGELPTLREILGMN